MKLKIVCCTAALLLLLKGTSAFADDRQAEGRLFEFSVAPGAAIPTDVDSNDISNGAFLQGSFFAPVTSWLSAGLETGYAFKANHPYNVPAPFAVNSRVSVLQVTPAIEIGRWYKTSFGGVKPYLAYGGGYYQVHAEIDASSPFDSFSEHRTEGHGGFNYGGGALFALGSHVAVGPDVRYHQVFMSNVSDYKYLTATMRLAVLF
jgi:opacity protein-like surface antigen